MRIEIDKAEWSTLFPELKHGAEVSASRLDEALEKAESSQALSQKRVAELRLRLLDGSNARGDVVRKATPCFRAPRKTTEDAGSSNLLAFRVDNAKTRQRSKSTARAGGVAKPECVQPQAGRSYPV